MNDQELLARVTLNPKVMVGKLESYAGQLFDRFVVVTETQVRFAGGTSASGSTPNPP